MDDERGRQQRDLQRATLLLETMSREELVDMLHDILFNERSDDTHKLSDWMAFQIIIQDETRDARKLLAQLGKDGRNHRRVEISKFPSASSHNHTISRQEIQGEDDGPEEDSSSTASFVTCSEAETSQCTPAQGTVNIGASQPTDKTSDEATPAEASGISGSFSEAKGTPSGDKQSLEEMDLPSSAPGARDRDHGRDNRASWTQRWYGAIFRQRNQTSSEPNSNKTERHRPVSLLIPATSILQAAARQDDTRPTTHPQATRQPRKAALEARTLQTTNELGYKNLADLYAKFDMDYVESLKADLLNIDAGKTRTLDLALSVTSSAFEDMKKMQCQFCKLYFTTEQNFRELDNGLSPCSYHPGVPERSVIGADTVRNGWTCCNRAVSVDDTVSGLPKKSRGCANGYHYEMKKTRCYICDGLFTDEDNQKKLNGSSPCSYHPGWPVPDGKLSQVWTCCQKTTNSKGPLWDRALDPKSPGCKKVYHHSRDEAESVEFGIRKPKPFL